MRGACAVRKKRKDVTPCRRGNRSGARQEEPDQTTTDSYAVWSIMAFIAAKVTFLPFLSFLYADESCL